MRSLLLNCNPFTIGGGTIYSLFVLYPEWTKQTFSNSNNHRLLYMMLILGAFPNFFFDLFNLVFVWRISFMAHYDPRNFGYIVAKIVTNGFLIMTLENIARETDKQPKTKKFSWLQ